MKKIIGILTICFCLIAVVGILNMSISCLVFGLIGITKSGQLECIAWAWVALYGFYAGIIALLLGFISGIVYGELTEI